METTITTSTNVSRWEIIPANTAVGIVFAILFFYLSFRHFLFVLMFMDIILGWLRKFNWFPKEGNRRKTFIHWLIALGMFFGFFAVAGKTGWLEFIPQ